MAWSMFCQGWLGMLPEEAADQLLERTGLKNQYVAVEVVDGQPRSCGGCGSKFQIVPGAKVVVCDGCGRTLDVGSAEIPCTGCGGTITLPKGVDNISCPYCKANVEKVGIL
jgi:LSD1 subclass zinc finger protein